ncbi:hypothetical protein FQ154_18230 [Paeniglutamicibacter gangotriensis]|uniref:Uncharacterized protein n=1 Tax=Paeniglutamicibacter gangotriensis TaxID=254787 RepID=A0A5B0E461_9MICC|nr:hypothetical protein [Paeniglutamicibacter gangotriensis]KAA0973458.1 hypothetical protein FQ154_18230 [Paeniglutamicibacter gangotriensis]
MTAALFDGGAATSFDDGLVRQRRAYPISAAAEAHRRGLKIIALKHNPSSPLARSITEVIALAPALA